ncbi:MAG: 1-phosphofructokinase family hexose kinase [Candidatus Kariarchaeaceae archaeon]|jgi:1-phosphofructokinase family hexose kinase
MILTVTINPLLEQRFTYKRIVSDRSNRDGKLIIAAGGKGINVSRQLNKMNTHNSALTFSGGTYGKLFRESVRTEGLNVSFIHTKSETRICSVIIHSDECKAQYYFGENSRITKDETDKFITQMEKMIQNCELVIFSGSSPCKETDVIFPIGIELANKYNKISICDTYGSHLENCLSASPQIIHNNMEEISLSLNNKLQNESDTIELLNHLYKDGIKQVFLTNGAKNYYASNFDFHYKVAVPKIETIDSTGSGDALVAGIAYSWHNNLTFENQTKLATALGTLNAAMFDVCNVSHNVANEVADSVTVEPLGKKMKIINDTPD